MYALVSIRSFCSAFAIRLIIFFIFIFLATFTVLNMLIGILCEIVAQVATAQKEKVAIDFVKLTIAEDLRKMSCEEDGLLTYNEFMQLLEFEDVKVALEDLSVDVLILFFIMLDLEFNSTGGQI